jgi:hypothetical protein
LTDKAHILTTHPSVDICHSPLVASSAASVLAACDVLINDADDLFLCELALAMSLTSNVWPTHIDSLVCLARYLAGKCEIRKKRQPEQSILAAFKFDPSTVT